MQTHERESVAWTGETLEVGDVLGGRWELGEELGRGAMGRVFATRDLLAVPMDYASIVPSRTELVLKVLEVPELEDRLRAEDELLAALSHPGFPQLWASGFDAARRLPFSVRTRLPGRPLTPSEGWERGEVIEVAVELIDALSHLHRHGFVHGDIAPDNALRDPAERPLPRARLLDLGAAGRAGATSGAVGTTSGALPYVAPERLRGAPLTPLSDVWSLGALLWGLLFGTHPLPGYPARDLAARPAARPADPLAEALRRMLHPDPQARFPDLDAAREALIASHPFDAPALADLRRGDARRARLPYLDRGARVSEALARMGEAVARSEALAIEAPPAGRTRWLHELLWRDTAHPVKALCPGGEDDPTAALLALFPQLGLPPGRIDSAPALLLEPLLRSGGLIAFDDLDQRPALSSVVETLVSVLRVSPRLYAPTVILTAGLARSGTPELREAPWDTDDLAALLALTYPGRRPTIGTLEPFLRGAGSRTVDLVPAILALAETPDFSLDSRWLTLPAPARPLPTRRPPPTTRRPATTPEAPPEGERAESPPRPEDLMRRGRQALAETDYRAAMTHLEAALAMRPAPSLTLEATIHLARAAVLGGELDKAREAIAAAESLRSASAPPAPLLETSLDIAAGLEAWFRADLDVAEAHLQRAAARLDEAVEDPGTPSSSRAAQRSERAAARIALGLVAHRRSGADGQAALARAEAWYRAALEDAEEARDPGRALGAMQNLGVVQHERGDLSIALDTYQRAYTLAEALGQRARVVQLANNLGNLWRYLGAPEAAAPLLERALALAREDQSPHAETLACNLLGDVAADRADRAAAEARYRDALRTAEAHGLLAEQTEISLNLGRLALTHRDHTRAAEVLGRAEHLARTRDQTALLGLVAAALEALAHQEGRDPDPTNHARIADGLRAATNSDGRWPLAHALALSAQRRGDAAQAQQAAEETLQTLGVQRDRVPAEHRAAFDARPDRRQAIADAEAILAAGASLSPPPRGPAEGPAEWTRMIEVAKRLASERDPDRLLAYLMDSAILLTGAERAFLVLTDSPEDPLSFDVHLARNLDRENIRQRRDKISRSIVTRVLTDAEPILTVDAMEDSRYRAHTSVHAMRLRSILCVPMRASGQILGAVYLDNRFQTAVFSERDLRALEALADLAALALDTARTFVRLSTQRDQLEAARAEVSALNERLALELDRQRHVLESSREQSLSQPELAPEGASFAGMIGSCPAMRRLYRLIDRLQRVTLPVLIEGESGTGKELVARAIHDGGDRASRAFLAVNCGAIPAGLIESELFGHVRGAFSGAHQDRRGLFESADGGTLFLDEIGELPIDLQVRLLRVLQSGEFQRVGSTRTMRVDVRILAATNRDLEAEITAQRFREDLFYRLSVVRLAVPPLRDRRDDIPQLARHFIQKHRAPEGPTEISPRALRRLSEAEWPGNVRQLETTIRSALVFCDTDRLDLEDLPASLSTAPDAPHATAAQTEVGAGITPLADLEKGAILRALEILEGNKSATARALGIDRRTLYNKLAGWGL